MASDQTNNKSEKEASQKPRSNPQKQAPNPMESPQLKLRMGQVKRKILVLSGKGGVGKSTVAANLALSLALSGKEVGLLDVDIHGPNIPKLFNIESERVVAVREDEIQPVNFEGMNVMSIGFLLGEKDRALIWRGPMKMQVIKQFLEQVVWGARDFLVIDCPPGTGDEPLSIAQLVSGVKGAIVVTTPQDLATSDVRKCINFCIKVNVPVLGVIENMSGFVCPKCGERTEVFKSGGGQQMARGMNVPFLGKIPLDPQVAEASDDGKPFVRAYSESKTAEAFSNVIKPILELEKTNGKTASSS